MILYIYAIRYQDALERHLSIQLANDLGRFDIHSRTSIDLGGQQVAGSSINVKTDEINMGLSSIMHSMQ